MTVAKASRLHYMDAMRSVLMLLGVVLHSARPYDSYAWRVKDAQTIPALDGVVATLHSFRMPAFFVIAGFFGMFLLSRPTAVFLRERMRRVLVPLIAMLLSINLVQVWFLARQREVTGGFIDGVVLPALWNGRLASHLWFLSCLAIYFALTALLAPWLRRLATPPVQPRSTRADHAIFFTMLTLAVVAPLGVAIMGSLTAPALSLSLLGLVKLSTALLYLPFFAVGVMLCAFPVLLERFARCSVAVIVLGVCGAIGAYLTAGREEDLFKAVQVVSGSLLTWMAVRVVFAVFRQWANRPSVTFRYLSDASYSIYLFHHLVVIVTATWLLPVDIDAWFKFLIVLTTASLVSLGLHHFVILRHAWFGYLFNGRAIASARRRYARSPALPADV
jgi:glucans biosynthesis protein C